MMIPSLSFITLTVLSVVILTAAPAADAVSSQVVLDIAGHPVQSNDQYYIIPAKIGTGGGLIPSSRDLNTQDLCLNLDIVQSSSPFVSGLPVTFSPLDTKTKLVQLSTSLNLEFDSTVWLCPESKIWRIDHSVQLRKSFVSIGGEKGKGNSWFQIQEDGDAYKLMYCPSSSTVACINVSLEIDDLGARRLVLSNDQSFTVEFQKAYDSNSNCHLESNSRMFPFIISLWYPSS
ncbi:PREDICTED: bark lectin isoform X1 [Camelina sativa]|uniref:Bark lectin isoform X1 n=1 Tax=Camelina sativa TaxID=90675 RepID=A0ABM0TLS9_CAMSA|nr:PREDICTED: bark lectin isoform X1 [Camelina sativa]